MDGDASRLNRGRSKLPESVESARIGPWVGALGLPSHLAGLSESLGLGGFGAGCVGVQGCTEVATKVG